MLWGSAGIPTLLKALSYPISVAFSTHLHDQHVPVPVEGVQPVPSVSHRFLKKHTPQCVKCRCDLWLKRAQRNFPKAVSCPYFCNSVSTGTSHLLPSLALPLRDKLGL